MKRFPAATSVCAAVACGAAANPNPPAVSPASAIREFESYCSRGEMIWGRSLCGPIIFVDPSTKAAVANVRPGPGFVEQDGVWTGTLPDNVGLANTSIELNGRRFAEIILPLPTDTDNRRVLMAHESFHRIQPDLGFKAQEADNSHLDTKDGRIWARLEIAALEAALGKKDWRPAARDALMFRAKRLALFPNAEEAETRLIANEGLAEYTGVKVGAAKHADEFAITRLESGAGRQSLIRSFGYVVGPAYGLLLDRLSSNWRLAALKGRPLPELLEESLLPSVGSAPRETYREQAIVAEETARDVRIKKRRLELVAEFIDGPTVTFPANSMNVFFDANTLFSLGDSGTVYSQATEVKDDWGSLKSSGDVLVSPGWTYARVQGPAKLDGHALVGPNWTAELAPGYTLVSDKKLGSFIVQKQ